VSRQAVLGALPRVHNERSILVFDNRLLGRKQATVSADSVAEEGNFGASNLLSEFRSDAYRSGSVSERSAEVTPEIRVTFTLGSPRDVDWLSYDWSNVMVPWRADLYRGNPASAGTLAANTGWMNPVVKAEASDFDHGTFPWSLGPSEERVRELCATMRMKSFCHLSSPVYGVTHVRFRFDVSDGANGLVDFLQVGLMYAARAFQPRINPSTGAKLVPVNRASVKRTASGAVTGLNRRPGQEVQFSLDHLTDDEGYRKMFMEMGEREGPLGRVFVYFETANDLRQHFYHGGAFTGTAETFDALSFEEPGELDDVVVSKQVTGMKIQETE
jgi:hypothetical protein